MVRLQDVILLVLSCNVICQPVEGRKRLFIRESLHHDRLKDLDLDMIEHLDNGFGRFPAPADMNR